MKKGFTTPFSSFFPGLFFYFFAFFDSLTPVSYTHLCGFARFNVLKALCVSAKASAAHTRSRGSGGFEIIIPQTPSGLQEDPRLAGASEATERKQRPGTAAFINRKGLHSFCEGKRPTPCHALRHAAKSTGRPKAPSSTRRFYSAASPR